MLTTVRPRSAGTSSTARQICTRGSLLTGTSPPAHPIEDGDRRGPAARAARRARGTRRRARTPRAGRRRGARGRARGRRARRRPAPRRGRRDGKRRAGGVGDRQHREVVGQLLEGAGDGEVEGPDGRTPQRGQVAAHAERGADVAGDGADVGAAASSAPRCRRRASRRRRAGRAPPARGSSPGRALQLDLLAVADALVGALAVDLDRGDRGRAPGRCRRRAPRAPSATRPRLQVATPAVDATTSPSASSVVVETPSRTVASYAFSVSIRWPSSRVARLTPSTSTPVAIGSSVPAWPTLRVPASRRTRATTSCEVMPAGPCRRRPDRGRPSGAVVLVVERRRRRQTSSSSSSSSSSATRGFL